MGDIIQRVLTGERALFQSNNLDIVYSTFADGESPLKESCHINVDKSSFKWKYPLWYSSDIEVSDSILHTDARAGIWYTNNVTISDTVIEAPKTFRRAKEITLTNVVLPNASETLWMCDGVEMNAVTAAGDYFAMNTNNIKADQFTLTGNYSFDGCKNIEISNAKMLSKDAFWNCEDVVVTDSVIVGEYIGWNSKNLTFINCTIESLQGFCYIENLVLTNCRLLNTPLAFEYSTVDIDVTTVIDSIKNPISGTIRAKGIGEIIFDDPKINPRNTSIFKEGIKYAI